MKTPVGGLDSPKSSPPQHSISKDNRIPHVCSPPAATAPKPNANGGLDSPESFLPQQTTQL